MARRRKSGLFGWVVLACVGFGAWWVITSPRRDFEDKLDKGVQQVLKHREEIREKAKEELRDLLDNGLGK